MKKYVVPFVVAFAMIFGIAASAKEGEKSISVSPMSITVNGQAVTLTRPDGTPEEIFAYNGVTYVSLNCLSELLGVDVEQDGTSDNTAKLVSNKFQIPDSLSVNAECNVPVLMYHHFADKVTADTVVSGERFREHMTALQNAGYHTITVHQLIDYVDNGSPLPSKPIWITMDDGYASNLEIAAPILEELGMCATVFVIGISEGEEYYVHNGTPLFPRRFAYEDAMGWVEKGVLDLQSHTMDMHQLESYGISGRNGMLSLPGESEEEYKRAVLEDMRQFWNRREGRVATDLCVVAYPFGYCTEGLDRILDEAGIRVTLTIQGHSNLLKIGDRGTLRMLGRYNVTERMTGEALVKLLEQS